LTSKPGKGWLNWVSRKQIWRTWQGPNNLLSIYLLYLLHLRFYNIKGKMHLLLHGSTGRSEGQECRCLQWRKWR
jgi:hypothetical protein